VVEVVDIKEIIEVVVEIKEEVVAKDSKMFSQYSIYICHNLFGQEKLKAYKA